MQFSIFHLFSFSDNINNAILALLKIEVKFSYFLLNLLPQNKYIRRDALNKNIF